MRKIFLIVFTILFFMASFCYAQNTPIYTNQGGADMVVGSGGTVTVQSGGDIAVESGGAITLAAGSTFTNADATSDNPTFVQNIRERVTIAQLDAGEELLPAVSGKRYRVVDMAMQAYGGTCDNATAVTITGNQSGDAILLTVAVAALVDDTYVRAGDTNAVVTAEGVSWVSNTANTDITVEATVALIETCTGIDVFLSYVIE